MLLNKYDFAFIGGDMRQIYMINELLSLGYSIIAYGLHDAIIDNSCAAAANLSEAVLSSKIIIAPIPISKDGIHILSKSTTLIPLKELQALLTLEHSIFGGCFKEDSIEYFKSKGIYYNDFMEEEEIILYNSIATAEGAIAEAITCSTINLHDSSCLILGYGRCGRTLAQKLKYLCKKTDISARSKEQLAKGYTDSFGTIPLSQLETVIEQYDFIFNTIPSLILTKDILSKTKPGVIIIDIASHPGGVDFTYAKEIHRYTNLYLGIPGKVAPKSSAAFLNNYLLNQLRKK